MTARQALALAIQANAPVPGIEHAILQDPDCVVMYGRKFPRYPWPAAERVVLASNDITRIVEYAKSVVRGRWPAAELAISKHSDEKLHAKYAASLSVAEMNEEWAVQCPCWLETYADKVIGGKLPEHLHEKMYLFSFQNVESTHMKRYFGKYR